MAKASPTVDLSILLDPADFAQLEAAGEDPTAYTCLHLDTAQLAMGRAKNGQEAIQITALVPVGVFDTTVPRIIAPGHPPPTPLAKALAFPPTLKVVIRTAELTEDARQQFAEIARSKLAWHVGASPVVSGRTPT